METKMTLQRQLLEQQKARLAKPLAESGLTVQTDQLSSKERARRRAANKVARRQRKVNSRKSR